MTDIDGQPEDEGEDARSSRAIDLGDTRARIGLALVGAGLILVLVTWLQIRDVQNVAAQIPYVASGGLLGVALIVVGGLVTFAGDVRLGARERQDLDRMMGQIEELAATTRWTADGIEQIAAYLNQGATNEDDAEPRRASVP